MAPQDIVIPTYRQMLGALSAWLGKARREKGAEADALLALRLAPDMFPLATQIGFACTQAREAMYRLTGEDFPESLAALVAEARAGGERPGSIADAQARIAETIALVETYATRTFDTDGNRPIAHSLPNGMVFDLTAESYVRDWALPHFYFHLNAAYGILRQAGVSVGKGDYVAHIFACLRPGTMPA